MQNQTNKVLASLVLLVVGYIAGRVQWPESANAQEAVTKSAEDFVVVAGSMSATSRARYYYVVTSDGKAKKVQLDGEDVYARSPEAPSKFEVKHSLPSRIRLDHSGRISE